jgi:hypothetical protein
MSRLLIFLALAGCKESPGPRLDAVDPPWAYEGERPPLSIHGSGLRPKTRVDVGSGEATEDPRFVGTLGGRAFARIDIVSAHELDATVPAGLPVGLHDLFVTTPEGERLGIERAFEVVSADAGPQPPPWPPDAPAFPDLSLCGNGPCNDAVAGCPEAQACPACPDGPVWQTFGGTWRIEGTHTRQVDSGAAESVAIATGIDAADLFAQATFSVNATGSPGPGQVALLVRAESPCTTPDRAYGCILQYTPDARLFLVAWNGAPDPVWEEPPGGLPLDAAVTTGSDYTLRASANGTDVFCGLCTDGTCVAYDAFSRGTNGLIASGTVGLRTAYTGVFVRRFAVWTP